MDLDAHPCRRRACETVTWLPSEELHACGDRLRFGRSVSDPAMPSGSAYPSEVIMSRLLYDMLLSIRIRQIASNSIWTWEVRYVPYGCGAVSSCDL